MNRPIRLSTVCALVLCLAAGPNQTWSQTPPQVGDVVINMRDADIKDVAEQVSRLTGRTLILDPQVSGRVNVVSAQPLSSAGVWELFLSVLRTSGYAAVRSGNAWRIIPQASVIQSGSSEVGRATSEQQIVTRVIRLRNLPPDQAVRALRPLVGSYGSIEPITNPNGVVVTDYAQNIRRVQALAQSLDAGGGTAFDSVTLRYASAVDVARSIAELLGEEVGGARVTADERSNTVLIRGDAGDIAQARSIAQSLDRPGGATPITRVVRLSNGDAESISEIIRGLLGEPSATNPVSRSLRRGATGLASLSAANRQIGAASVIDGASAGQPAAAASPAEDGGARANAFMIQDVTIQPAPELNAIVMRGSPATVAMLEDLILQLDVRRPQVRIEVAIVEITGELGEQLGVQLGFGGAVPADGVSGGTSFSNVGVALGTVLRNLGVPGGAALAEGLSLAAGSENEFGLVVQALSQITSANLLSTPSVTVLDNEPAEIVVGQNVPFRTGSFATDGNSTNPFTTITREDVGLTLRVLPRVNDGDVVKLEVSQEVSSLVSGNVLGAADLVTNRRSIITTVLADDGEIVPLGGLITDDRQSGDSRVPGLGNLPVVGGLFRSRRDTQTRRTLFIFLKPTILRDREAVAEAARRTFERLREAEGLNIDTEWRPPAEGADPRLPVSVDRVF